MTATDIQPKALLKQPGIASAPGAERIVAVARRHGVSPLRQLREMVTLWLSKTRLSTRDYYEFGLYDPTLSMAEKKQFVGCEGSYRLNNALTPPALPSVRGVVGNKFLFSALIRQLGFRGTETQAVVATSGRFGATVTLTSAQALERFLRDEARYPLFGKPLAASGSLGSVLIEGLESARIVLGNGRRLGVDAVCHEILADSGGGYLLQSALRQHGALNDAIGPVTGTVRLVTIRDRAQPRPFYAVWKIPAPGAMSDNAWQDGAMLAPVDIGTGVVGEVWRGRGLEARKVETHPETGRVLRGLSLPFWDEACRMAAEAHALFPAFGVIGWDVALTEEGPLLVECNDNPFHTLYQLAHRRGIRNPETSPALERTIVLSEEMLREIRGRNLGRRARQAG